MTYNPLNDTPNVGYELDLTGSFGFELGSQSQQLCPGTFYRQIFDEYTDGYRLGVSYDDASSDASALMITGIRNLGDTGNGSLVTIDQGANQRENVINFLKALNAAAGTSLAGPVSLLYAEGLGNPQQFFLEIANVSSGADQTAISAFEFVIDSLDSDYNTAAWGAHNEETNFIYEFVVDNAGAITPPIPAGSTASSLILPERVLQSVNDVFQRLNIDSAGLVTVSWRNQSDSSENLGTIVNGQPMPPAPFVQLVCDGGVTAYDKSLVFPKNNSIASSIFTLIDPYGLNDFADLMSTNTVDTTGFDTGADWYYTHLVTDANGLIGFDCGQFTPTEDCVPA